MLWNWLIQTCTFFKKFHGMCKYCPIVVFRILLQNVYNLFNVRLSLAIFTFAHHHVAHSFVLSIFIFHYIPHVLISSKCWRGSNKVSFLGYCQGFIVISHTLSIMLKVSIYSIIDSNVFGVKIDGNFPLAIIK